MIDKQVLAFDLGGTRLKWGIVNSNGVVITDDMEDITDHSEAGVVDQISAVISRVKDSGKYTVSVAGIGAPGLVYA